MRTLVIGGARSGKSRTAEQLVGDRTGVTYVATGYPPDGDPEWEARVRRHRADRPAGWRTRETLDLPAVLADPDPGGPVLVDCLTLWLTRTLDAAAWETGASVEPAVAGLVDAVARCGRELVLVTNEVGQGVIPAEPSARRFVDEMGRLNQRVAEACDDVLWVVAGRAVRL